MIPTPTGGALQGRGLRGELRNVAGLERAFHSIFELPKRLLCPDQGPKPRLGNG